ncbi:hypothetical protein J1605_023288 [Eschrichtius robustus]|uniref:Proteasome activator PA28 C-terminal domain-containing protein n=1 Tax=Eschrichtius robustus TaxID=9764 RepID=A0AB34H5C0_ESCRO|nr:hypothetical protein J1605_023288 [Eschrichtius robustus]
MASLLKVDQEVKLKPTYKKRRLDECEEAFQGTKVFVMPNGMLKSNQQLVDIIEKVKPEIRLLIEKCNTEDYRRTVTEIDEKEYISLRLIISELRNQYVTLHDMILKNIEKIKRPRSSNAETLY